MGSFFFRARPKEKLAVIFDIGSASVGAALTGFRLGDVPKVFYTTRHEMAISKELNSKDLTEKMLVALRQAARDIANEGFPHVRFTLFNTIQPQYTFFILASPWHISQVRIIQKKETRPFYVNKELIRDVVFNELNAFRKLYAAHAEGRPKENSYEIIEGDILDIRLNRYQTHDPVGKTAHELEMTLFASAAPRELTEKIQQAGGALFTRAENYFASFTFAFFNAVRDVWHDKHHYILLDISGEVSDISVVKDGRLLETSSFPMGRNTIIRRIALALNLSISETSSMLSLYNAGHLGNKETGKIKRILADAGIEWLRFFSKELSEISSQILIPRDIFLTADDPLKQWFKNILSSDALSRSMSLGRPFVMTALDGETLATHCRTKDGVDKDPFLLVESLFLNKKINVV